ncbi:MAG: class I SAM-dependent methyltransferase [Sphingobacteriales bacterium]|nr:MAG: class I SAM-dependent methyltransferase [Sphingobacteriales bacterium]
MHLNSELLFKKYYKQYFTNNLYVLEIGPAGIPSAYSKFVNNDTLTWHTLDFADTTYIASNTNKLTYIIQNPYQFPIPDEQYDIVVSGQVIEHVQDIWLWLTEMKRILKKGGMIFIISPISWPYHEAPLDCWRIYPSAYEAMAHKLNIELVFSKFETLEIDLLKKLDSNVKTIPGKSFNYEVSMKRIRAISIWNRVIRLIPIIKNLLIIPFEVSYDTITVFKK